MESDINKEASKETNRRYQAGDAVHFIQDRR